MGPIVQWSTSRGSLFAWHGAERPRFPKTPPRGQFWLDSRRPTLSRGVLVQAEKSGELVLGDRAPGPWACRVRAEGLSPQTRC